MTRGLTAKQEAILEYIVEQVEERGFPPSIREIGNKFEISSLRGVTVHLDALERKGMIKRLSTSRSITVLGRTGASAPEKKASFVPLVGSIAAGIPITAQQNIEAQIPVPRELIAPGVNAFALRVKGDSMINKHIQDGDLVIVRQQPTAENGDIVAVLLGDEATVKTIEFTKTGCRLLPANENYQPIEIEREDSSIMGKVIGLVRNMDGQFLL